MRSVWGSVVAAAMVVTFGTAHASESQSAREFGATRPPVGFVKFCAKNPNDCQVHSATIFTPKQVMTPELWDQVFKVNASVNHAIKPMSDQDLYGQTEYWTYPIDAGDCEDYVLLKKRMLTVRGLDAAALRITVVLDEKGDGHAVLTLTSSAGDFILDNRRDDILRWTDVHYTFLKRQSDSDPLAWVALGKQSPVSSVVSTKSGK
jgi:predicted transglutaminase-like cysteine proteinase